MDPQTLSMIMKMLSGGGQGGQSFNGMGGLNFSGPGSMSSGQGGGMGSGMGGGMGNSIAQLLSGIFGDSGAPYGDAMKEYQKHFAEAKGYQKPFYEAGTGAIGSYQDWLKQMKDPSAFINKQMEGYQASPWSQNLQRQSMNAANNAGSASGLSGSTPMMAQAQQNASDIASGDQNQWLQNVLGVNNQYGAGQKGMMDMGQGAANNLSSLSQMLAQLMGKGAYGQKAGENQDFWNMISGGAGLLFG